MFLIGSEHTCLFRLPAKLAKWHQIDKKVSVRDRVFGVYGVGAACFTAMVKGLNRPWSCPNHADFERCEGVEVGR
jgi:hypothetical protein